MNAWYKDAAAYVVILVFSIGIAFGGYIIGVDVVVNHCKTYGAYKISEEEAMLCVVKPLLKNNHGEMNYLRPEGKEVIKPGKMT